MNNLITQNKDFIPFFKLSAAECNLLLDWKANEKDIISLIYEWSLKWIIWITIWKKDKNILNLRYLNIFNINKKDLLIKRLKPLPHNAKRYEIYIYNEITNKYFNEANIYLCCNRLINYGIEQWRFLKKSIKKNQLKKLTKTKIINIILCIIIIILSILFTIICYFSSKFLIAIPIIFLLFALYKLKKILHNTNFRLWYCDFSYKLSEKWTSLKQNIIYYKKILTNIDNTTLNQILKNDPWFAERILPIAISVIADTKIFNTIKENYNIKKSNEKIT